MSSSSNNTGMGLTGGVFLVFLILKLADIIDWSWWWITAPLWGGLAIGVAILAVLMFVAIITGKLK